MELHNKHNILLSFLLRFGSVMCEHPLHFPVSLYFRQSFFGPTLPKSYTLMQIMIPSFSYYLIPLTFTINEQNISDQMNLKSVSKRFVMSTKLFLRGLLFIF